MRGRQPCPEFGWAAHSYRQPDSHPGAFSGAFTRTADLVAALRRQGLPIDVVDCGGGLGIPYRNDPASDPAGLAAP